MLRFEPARLSQFAAQLDRTIRRMGGEAEHDRGRKRPRLRGMIIAVDHAHTGFLEHFAAHGIFQGFAGLNETGQGRVTPFRPLRTAPEQAGVATGDDDDDGRIGARKLFESALWIRTLAAMAGGFEPQWSGAGWTEARALLPVRQTARVGKH